MTSPDAPNEERPPSIPSQSDEAIRHREERMMTAAYAACRDRSWAEDAVQEAHLAFHAKTPEEQGAIRDPEGWLIRVCVNQAVTRLRREAARQRVENEYATQREKTANTPEQVSPPVMDLLVALTPRSRSILWMRVVQNRPFSEIAQRFNITESTARVIFHQETKRMFPST